jgi:hypothetical protein
MVCKPLSISIPFSDLVASRAAPQNRCMHKFPRTSYAGQLLVALMAMCFLAVATPVFGATLSASPTKINYGSTVVNSGPYYYVTLTNKGGGTAQISWVGPSGGQASSFKVAGPTAPFSLAQGKSASFQVKFTPKTTGTFATTFSVFSSNSVRVEVPLTGVSVSGGTTTPPPTKGTLTISPSSLSYGNVTVGTTSSKTVTLSASTASVQITNATTTNQEFTISGLTLPATIASGKSITVTVNFKPTASGSTSTQMSLTDNAVTSPGVITATGAGTSLKQHTVGLTWSPSSSAVAGYNVYRGTTTGGPYTKINGSAIVTTSYSDTTVASGKTYFYVTSAVNSSSIESAKSNEAKAVVPTP